MLDFVDITSLELVPTIAYNDGRRHPVSFGLWVNRKRWKLGTTEQEKADIQAWIDQKGVTVCPPAYGTGSTADIGDDAKAFHKARNGGLDAIEKLWSDKGAEQIKRNQGRIERRVERMRAKYAEQRKQKAEAVVGGQVFEASVIDLPTFGDPEDLV